MTDTALTTFAPVDASLSARLTTVHESGGIDQELLNEFSEFIATAPDEFLFRANPYQFAQATGIAPQRALDLFLHATHAGIFDLDWGVICPNCSSFITSPGGLRAITEQAHCAICRVDVEASADDNVEVAFTVAPSVRRIRFHSPDTIDLETDWNRLYYSTNRALHPQAAEVLQDSMIEFSRLPENGVAQIQVNLEPSLYVINAPRHHSTALFDVQPDAPLREVTFDIFDGRIVPDQVSLATGQVTINIRNRTGHSMVYSLMHDLYTLITTRLPAEIRPDEHHSTILPYVTAKDLATSQVFRDLFRAESIPSELGLSFKSVTFLFSDLKGSTQLYERVGDIRAYELVREHFILLQEIIQELGGAIVKTIGDAVMASFATPLPALEAALLINREIEKLGADEPLQVKMGIHTGSCIAVESNDRLDYFGRTVNIAARAQGVADAGEIVVTEAVYNSTGAVEAIQSAGMRAEGNCGMLKGIEDAIQLYRLS